MTERKRNLQFRDGLREQGLEADLFPDQARGVLKPMDLVACAPDGRFWAIEGKAVDVPSWDSKMTLLSPRSFRPKQLPKLLNVAASHGRASVALYVVPPRERDVRAWLLSAGGVARRFAQGGVIRLDDVLGETATPYELVWIPKVGWGLPARLLAQLHLHSPVPVVGGAEVG